VSATHSINDHIRQLEEQLLRPEVRASRAALSRLLADEFVEFASDGGVYTKVQVIDALQREVAYSRSLTDFHLWALADHVVLVTYRAVRRDQSSSEIVESLRSSVWTHREDQWQLLFHQGTRAAP
jgi:hypothetical protein